MRTNEKTYIQVLKSQSMNKSSDHEAAICFLVAEKKDKLIEIFLEPMIKKELEPCLSRDGLKLGDHWEDVQVSEPLMNNTRIVGYSDIWIERSYCFDAPSENMKNVTRFDFGLLVEVKTSPENITSIIQQLKTYNQFIRGSSFRRTCFSKIVLCTTYLLPENEAKLLSDAWISWIRIDPSQVMEFMGRRKVIEGEVF